MPAGRPTTYSAEVGEGICQRLMAGESLRSICTDDDMPAQSTVYLWLLRHTEFSENYTRAREVQADTLADDVLSISDDARNDWMERAGQDDPGWQANGENIQRSRLRVDARKWLAGKLAPKKYGDKITQEHTGPNGADLFAAHVEALNERGRPKPGG